MPADNLPSLKLGDPFKIAMLLFPNLTQLDLTAPHEVFKRVRGVEVVTVWKNLHPVKSMTGLALLPEQTMAECQSADLLCVPGGPGHLDMMQDDETLAWIRQIAAGAKLVTSVCTGALVLGAAGLLRGYRATTHWGSIDALPLLGATAVQERVVWDRNRVTGGGVTAGIDFGLQIIARLWGDDAAEMAQLTMEYDPAPPFDSGSPRSARPELLARAETAMQGYRTKIMAAATAAAARFS
jgi:cyclohexyl-isocyanide hydratase